MVELLIKFEIFVEFFDAKNREVFYDIRLNFKLIKKIFKKCSGKLFKEMWAFLTKLHVFVL